MAATVRRAPGNHLALGGQKNAIITAAETNDLVTGPARLCKLLIWTLAASGVTVDIYDAAAANTNRVWSEAVGASALVIREFQLPMEAGMRVTTSVVSGTFGVNVTYY